MCRYIFHHYTRCGHIANFDFHSCVDVINLLRGLSQPGSDLTELACTNVKVEHNLCSTKIEVYCLQCEIDFQRLTQGTEAAVQSIPDYISIEGLDNSGPIITTKMQWQVTKSRKRDFTEAFLDLDLDGDPKSDSSNCTTVRSDTIANASTLSSPELWHDSVDVPLDAHDNDAANADKDDCGPNPAKKRNDSISEDYVVIGTDILTTQAERLTSAANGEEESDEDDFCSLWLSDFDSDSGDGDTGDATGSIKRQLERFTFPTYRSTPRSPDLPCSPHTRPRPDPLPLYVGFPGQPPERSPRTLRPSSRGNYLDARTELQSPVFDGFPGILPDEEELGLQSPGLVSFPRIVIEDVDEEEKEKENEKEKVDVGKSTGTVLGPRGASLASGSGCAAAVLRGWNIAMSRK
ncbi:uncharacterized protein P174DRAFT_428756 [Aspergillus novofumigatus IBT 16806]|uniref:Uncharacterized protein n=1 Tax=Aspergillus novofumigatus (strain IBT 16806) TaxID=1392255 RepID=A0A2I1CI65_ASPN1|nr:uncharacterized protein P174DRAFT_428756 [Aspergillus novofumigatus IBT 16806]PKX97300.1 hypothetical protein P174DRAFT_428756 [Aspergillus novofumigatus IBT 16806]